MGATGNDVAQAALAVLSHVPPVPYKLGGRTMQGFDCQGFCAYCVEQSGGKAGWTDSNMLARNYIEGNPIPYSIAQLEPGMVGLRIETIGIDTPARYKDDAFAQTYGDCTHAGIITVDYDDSGIWSVDASSSAGQVRSRTQSGAKNCWTHAAKLKGVQYGSAADNSEGVLTAASDYPRDMVVNTDENGLSFRKKPEKLFGIDNRIPSMPRIPQGATVTVLSDNGQGWSNVSYGGFTGWVSSEYLTDVESATAEIEFEDMEVTSVELSYEDAAAIIRVANRLQQYINFE